MPASVRIAPVIAIAWFATTSTAERPVEPNATHDSAVVTYEPPKSAGVVGAARDHVEHTRGVMARLARPLPHPVRVVFRECGTANAYYVRADHAIVICHELWVERRARYIATGHDRATIERQLREAMTFTVLHEFAHALHQQLDLPILGSAEDAADEIATLSLVQLGMAGAAASAARGHYLRGNTGRFWDDHGTGAQRGFAIACKLYGADPARHAALMIAMKVPAGRRQHCRSSYPARQRAWRSLLARSAARGVGSAP
jgi:hypothetical protein